jgi:hypothetical protein
MPKQWQKQNKQEQKPAVEPKPAAPPPAIGDGLTKPLMYRQSTMHPWQVQRTR